MVKSPLAALAGAPAHWRIKVVDSGIPAPLRQAAGVLRRHGGRGQHDAAALHDRHHAFRPEQHGFRLGGIDDNDHRSGHVLRGVRRIARGTPAGGGEAPQCGLGWIKARDRHAGADQRTCHTQTH